MGRFLEESGLEGDGDGGGEEEQEVREVPRRERRGSRRLENKRKLKRRMSRRRSSFAVTSLAGRDEEELMQVYSQPHKSITEEDILENLQTQKEIIENVKTQPWKMGKKMKMLRLARAYVEKFEGKLSRGKGYQQKWKTMFRQLKRSWDNTVTALVPWEMRIKGIESHFGSVVASYFVFLRWLIWINIWLTFLPVCFVILPELMVGEPHGSILRKQVPADEEETAADLKTMWNAEGILKYSVVFYGYYSNTPTIGSGYRMPLAYLLTTLAGFALSFIFVLKTMAGNSRQSRMSTKDEHFTFSWKLFTEWDYMVGNKETANQKHAAIVTTFKESILEEEEKTKEGNKHLLLFLRILANVLVLISLALSTYIIQLFVDRSREMELKKRKDKNHNPGFWAENELTVIMTLISTLFPNVSDLVSLMEKYHPRVNLRLQLARIFALNLLNLYTLFIALYNKQEDLKSDMKSHNEEFRASIGNDTILCSTNSTLTTTPSTVFNATLQQNCTPWIADAELCWETMIGQEVFKLTIMDLIFTLGQIIIIDYVRGIFIRYCNGICCWDMEKKFPEYPEFKTAENLLHLINNQGVIWLGTFFAPGLPVLNMGKLFLLVYIRCWSVMVCNVPQERIFRASRSNNFYYALLLVMLFLCMLPPLFAIVGVEPSPGCGPFSGQEKMFHVLTEAMENGLPPSVNSVIDYAASPGVIIPVFLLLVMTIYYLVSVGRSLRESNNDLRNQLEYERTEGRRKVYAMADAKRPSFSGRKGPEVPPKPKAKKGMSGAVSQVLAAGRIAKMMRGGGESRQRSVSPTTIDRDQLPVAVVHGNISVKEKGVRDKLKRAALRCQDRKLARYNKGYEVGDDEEMPLSDEPMTNGILQSFVAKTHRKRGEPSSRPNTDRSYQNIEVGHRRAESSDDAEIILRPVRSVETKPKSRDKHAAKKAFKELIDKPQARKSRSSSKEAQSSSKKSSSNTSVEIINETVQAEVNIAPKRPSPSVSAHRLASSSSSVSAHHLASSSSSVSAHRLASSSSSVSAHRLASSSSSVSAHRLASSSSSVSAHRLASESSSVSAHRLDSANSSVSAHRMDSANRLDSENNLSPEKNVVTKSIPKITVEDFSDDHDASDDNVSLHDIKEAEEEADEVDVVEASESESVGSSEEDCLDNMNLSPDRPNLTDTSVSGSDDRIRRQVRKPPPVPPRRFRDSLSDLPSSDDQNDDGVSLSPKVSPRFARDVSESTRGGGGSRMKFAAILTKFKESESDAGSSDDQMNIYPVEKRN